MLKHHQTLCVLLAGGLTVPAVVGQEDNLLTSLDRTVTAIEHFTGLRKDLQEGKPGAIEAVIAATDEPFPATMERDQSMDMLRQDVARLQGQLDVLDTVAMGKIVDDPHNSGLTPSERTSVVLGAPAPTEVPNQESLGYSADALREARLLIRAKRFEEAKALLEKQNKTSETRYWMARALVGVGRDNDALAELELVAADDEAGDFQRWAEQDKRMIEIRIELLRAKGAQD